METEKSAAWSEEQLLMLLRAIKKNTPKHTRNRTWTYGMKALDWNQIAFEPFSPEECRGKWKEIFQRVSKVRTLPELIFEAEIANSRVLEATKFNPEYPKRPFPAHVSFYKENFAKLKKKYPNEHGSKLLQRAAKKYKRLPEEEKQQREENYKRARADYRRRVIEFKKCQSKKLAKVSGGTDDLQSDQEETNTEDPILTCKPPPSGYRLFCIEHPDLTVDVVKSKWPAVWKQHWDNLTETQRNEYIRRHKEMKQEHEVKLNEFLKDLDVEKQEQILKKYNLKRPKLKMTEFPGEPKKPPRGANIMFCSEQMRLLKEVKNAKQRFSVVNQMWSHLSKTEKEHYKKKLNKRVRQYCVELQRWFKTLTPVKQEQYWRANPSSHTYLHTPVDDDEEVSKCQQSDSESEDVEDSSSDNDVVVAEDEEEEDDDVMFDMF